MRTKSLEKSKYTTAPHQSYALQPMQPPTTHEFPEELLETQPLQKQIFSFQDLGSRSVLQFCRSVSFVHTLSNVGKRITDPNVLLLNSTQKEIVEMIIENNKDNNDQKAKFLKQKAGKYLKLLWRSQKYNDAFFQRPPRVQKQPHYATPIHNFKKHKLTSNNSFGSLSNKTDHDSVDKVKDKGKSKDKDWGRGKDKDKGKDNDKGKDKNWGKDQGRWKQKVTVASRVKRIHSQDYKFDKIRLTPRGNGRETSRQKSFEIDLTQNLAWKTMATTKNFQNMLKILRKQQ